MLKRVFTIVVSALMLAACGGPRTEITVLFTDFMFAPNTITVPAGQPITLTFNNEGAVEHDFVVQDIDVTDVKVQNDSTGGHPHMDGTDGTPEYDLHVATSAGGSNVLKFTALKPGTYRIFCSVEGHVEAGMVGELIVTE
jgi:uncharacterized cupredoxin-like copper-binding protein